MKKLTTILLAAMAAAALSCQKTNNDDNKFHPSTPDSLPDKPEVVIRDGSLYVNGESFLIKGAALNGDNVDTDNNQEFWKEAKEAGANTVRMYSVNTNAVELLDEMARKGLYVNLGLELPRQCEGFDYDNETDRRKTLASVKSIVDKLKDHPVVVHRKRVGSEQYGRWFRHNHYQHKSLGGCE